MHEVYEATALTPMRAARRSGYVDWTSQPSVFKHYPGFLFRYPFGEQSAFRIAELSRFVSARSTVGGRPYCRLNTPSAGNLHPVELYVQLRGARGVLSGIYHVDADREELVLIREIERDGLEPLLGMQTRFDGMLFVVSCVPFRSEWKYGERAVRYCGLDAGHQAGAVQAAAAVCGQAATIVAGFDAERLDRVMGFGEEEYACAVLAVGREGTKAAEPLKTPLMGVAPTDYCETNGYVPGTFAAGRSSRFGAGPAHGGVPEAVIGLRRSARRFAPGALPASRFEHFMRRFADVPAPLECHTVVLQAAEAEPGLYRSGVLQRSGAFAQAVCDLLAGQRFVGEAAMVAVFSAERFDGGTLMAAGAYAHRLHLEAVSAGLGFTGIGAFYDADLQRFLGTEAHLLYVCAVGKEYPENEA